MIFNVKLNCLTKVSKVSENTASLLFCKSNSEFAKYLKTNHLKISNLEKKNFNNEDNSEIKVWNSSNPNLTIIKKTVINQKFNNDFFRNYLAGLIKDIERNNLKTIFIEVPNYSTYKNTFKDEKYYYQTLIEGI